MLYVSVSLDGEPLINRSRIYTVGNHGTRHPFRTPRIWIVIIVTNHHRYRYSYRIITEGVT